LNFALLHPRGEFSIFLVGIIATNNLGNAVNPTLVAYVLA
jgi:hypothetical protein